MIKPTVGRIVLFHEAQHVDRAPGTVRAALITHVWSDTMVNLCVFDTDGTTVQRTSVYLSNGDAQGPSSTPFCEWMPYQKGQAAKAEAAERQLEAARPAGRLATLRRLVDDARQLAAGGLHANCADPTADTHTLDLLIDAAKYLNLAARQLEQAPDFVVAHGAASVAPAAGGE